MILAAIWIGIIAFGIIMYVILDGFDLGVGILAPFFPPAEKDLMISTILPVWDGNETWLVLGGAVLYGAFPLAFSILLPTLYLPILLMVLALLFRGVSFEFRLKADTSKQFWDIMFVVGSVVATLMQGIMLGAFVQGFHLTGTDIQTMVIPPYIWLTPFTLSCGVALIFGYALLASTWLVSKTVGALQQRCYKTARVCLWFIAFFALALSAWSPFIDPHIWSRWFNESLVGYLAVLPILSVIFWLFLWKALRSEHEYSPFWLTVGIFMCCYAGFIVSSYPYLVPRSIPFWVAAAPRKSLEFMLVGAIIMLPVLLFYTYHSYRIFRGKVTDVIKY